MRPCDTGMCDREACSDEECRDVGTIDTTKKEEEMCGFGQQNRPKPEKIKAAERVLEYLCARMLLADRCEVGEECKTCVINADMALNVKDISEVVEEPK